ncbi:tetratricopeptide (TPR) repeat protein [Nocardioides sp. BE266]|uniref:CHAT domain-containing protein n=1 Tax=Nocardioides sp. BE266 TaxID=2817725 RepID=UPI00285B1F6A|nr:CHAT domain-containing protein [Nocardioides sp. BE266]MDR7253628.1 tetratricopeptide (TPR) repeat protein [Nocardioides sp. BE266]
MVTRDEAEEVLRTVFADPGLSRTRARDELVPDPDPAVSSIGHQVLGILHRDVGETDTALTHLRTALRLARRVDIEREADVRATLGGSLIYAGRTRDGLEQLDRAAEQSTGLALARVLVRRAMMLSFRMERFEDGAADLRRALAILDASDDDIWRARALQLEGLTRVGLGDIAAARRAFDESMAIHTALAMPMDVAVGVHNQGWLAFLEGDLPRALERYAEASDRYAALDRTNVDLVYDRCSAYLAAGMPADALDVVEQALVARPLLEVEQADLLLATAEAALAAGDPDRARSAADRACRLFRTQGRHQHWIRAEMMAVWARAESADPPQRLFARATALVDLAREGRAVELPEALLLAARTGRRAHSSEAEALVAALLDEAATFRRSTRGTTRVLGWLATAERRRLAGDAGGVLRACERGLAALDEHRATLGSQELRALSSAHGAELAELGTRTALASGGARRLLRWSERWRASSLTIPSAFDQHDPETTADLAALRAQHRRIAEAKAEGAPTDRLQARAARLEESVRQRMFHLRGSGAAPQSLDVAELLSALADDDTVLVELTEVDGHLHALVAGQGRVRHLAVGEASAASAAVDFALFALRGAARGRRSQLEMAGARLQRALLGSALDHVGESRVVVSGTSALQGVPWGLVPGLAERPVTSTPSARLWLRARQSSAEADRRVLLVGPGLASGGAEVPAVAAHDPSAEVLDGAAATVEASLAALDGAALAHVAAHGHFREDSPLFSSLVMADGPLLVHDLQRLARPPHRVVLSACESGEMAPVGAQELLGLSAALLSMGTAGIVSSLGEVDDAATVEVMVALHDSLRRGRGLGEAMLAAREVAAGDQVLAATAASFTVLGV